MLTSLSGGLHNLVYGQELRVPEDLSLAEAQRFASPEHAIVEIIEWQASPAPVENATIQPPENAALRIGRPKGRHRR